MKNIMSNQHLSAKLKKVGQNFISFAQKITQTKFVGSIMQGFILAMPVIICSTLFILMAEIAPSFGLKYSETAADGTVIITNEAFFNYYRFCQRIYNLSYGFLGIFVVITITYSMCEKINIHSDVNKKLNIPIIVCAAISSYLLISLGWEYATSSDAGWSVLNSAIFGVKGLFISIIIGTSTPWMFVFCIKYNITIRLPKQVPQNISQSFLTIFPMLFLLLIWGGFGFAFAFLFKESFLIKLFEWMQPIFKNANSAWFFVLFGFINTLTWFVGIHTSVWDGITQPLLSVGLHENIASLANGQVPSNLWSMPLQTAAYANGGTGATIAIPLLIILFAKSKQMKSIGFVAFIPAIFQVNEPILFGVPMVLNPIMAIPFLLTPIIDCILTIVFVNVFNMPASTVSMPWSMPQFISVPIGSLFNWKSFILPWIMFAASFGMYLPFIIVQDKLILKNELNNYNESNNFVDFRSGIQITRDYLFNKQKHNEIKLLKRQTNCAIEGSANELNEKEGVVKNKETSSNKKYRILVICQGAGSSAMLAQSIKKGADKLGLKNFESSATSQGVYADLVPNMDLVIISPQSRACKKDVEALAEKTSTKVIQTKGSEFIQMMNDNDLAIKKVCEVLEIE